MWVVVVLAGVGAVRVLGAKTNNELTLPGTDSQAAFDVLADRFPPQQNGTSPFVFATRRRAADRPGGKDAIDATYRRMKWAEHVYSVMNPLSKDGRTAGLMSEDGTTGSCRCCSTSTRGSSPRSSRIGARRDGARAREPVSGRGGWRDRQRAVSPRHQDSELIGNISAMVILALVFGSLVAMGMPILTAVFALAIATT